MGRKGKNTLVEMQQLVIFHREKGKSYREISKLSNINKSTVADIIKRFKNEDRIDFNYL